MTIEVMRYKLNELRMMLNDGEHTEEQGILAEIIKELDKVDSAENKGDLISRQAVDDAIYEYSRSCDVNYAQIMEYIDKIPSVENKGEWIPVIDSYYEDGTQKESHWECSKCGSGKSGWGEFKFCPDCGSDMRGEQT